MTSGLLKRTKAEKRLIHNVAFRFISFRMYMKRNRIVLPGTGPQETAP